MSKLKPESNKNNKLNSESKTQLYKKGIKKIRKTLQSLTEMDIKASKPYNIIEIKKDENENKMVMPTIIPQKNYNENLEKIKQNGIIIENEINSDTSEFADSSDFENEED